MISETTRRADWLIEKSMRMASKNKEHGSLGEWYTLKTLLLAMAWRYEVAQSREDADVEAEKTVRMLAYAFLGRPCRSIPAPVIGWHEAGVVDEFLAKHLNLEEEEPFARCREAVLRLFNDIQSIPVDIKNTWDTQLDNVTGHYTNLFLGILET